MFQTTIVNQKWDDDCESSFVEKKKKSIFAGQESSLLLYSSSMNENSQIFVVNLSSFFITSLAKICVCVFIKEMKEDPST